MHLAPRTILGQLVTGSVVVQAVVFSVFFFGSVRHDIHETQKRDKQRLQRQTRTLADVLVEPLTTGNAVMLDHIVRAVPISVTILGARVTDAAGKTLRLSNSNLPYGLSNAQRDLLPVLTKHPAYRLLQDINGMEGVQPILVNGVVRGFVWVTPDLSITRRYPMMDLENLALYGACALLGNLLLVWWLSGAVARPLQQLHRATLLFQEDQATQAATPLPARAPNEAGELQAVFNTMASVIERQRRGTQETFALLDSLWDHAPAGFAFYDRQFRYVRLNENRACMHGLPSEAHLGCRDRDLLPVGASTELTDALENLQAATFASGVASREEEISGTAPGRTGVRIWQTSCFPVTDADGAVRWVGMIVTDITERRRAEESLRRSERLASAGRLAASIAHEINNPLESVTNLLYLLRTSVSLDEAGQEYVAVAQQELGRVAEITQQTLRFYSHSATATDVRLLDIFRSVLVLHRARTRPHTAVQLRVSDDAVVFGYPGELRQLFANLIGNALDAMTGGGVLYVRATGTRRMGKRGIRVTVADTGTGMTEAVARNIFQPFFTTKDGTGTGFGLWVCLEILAKHRATIAVRSRVARFLGDRSGSVFSMFLPYDGVPRGPVAVTSKAQVLADHHV